MSKKVWIQVEVPTQEKRKPRRSRLPLKIRSRRPIKWPKVSKRSLEIVSWLLLVASSLFVAISIIILLTVR